MKVYEEKKKGVDSVIIVRVINWIRKCTFGCGAPYLTLLAYSYSLVVQPNFLLLLQIMRTTVP